ncbi:MAG: hypothetical protein WC901_05265 [Candidatus Margulisiibacteriota bacterium]
MKKIFIAALLLLAVIFITSCSGSSPTSGNPAVPAATLAESLGLMAQSSCSIDDSIQEGTTVSRGMRAQSTYTYTSPEVGADQWWNMTVNYSSSSLTMEVVTNFKIYTLSGAVTTLVNLAVLETSDITTFEIYATYDIQQNSNRLSMNLGSSKTNPFILSLLGQSLTGPVSYTSSYQGTTYVIAMVYDLAFPTGSDYPSGTVMATIYENSALICTGTITFNSTSTATLAFSGGYSGTYTINLANGTATKS